PYLNPLSRCCCRSCLPPARRAVRAPAEPAPLRRPSRAPPGAVPKPPAPATPSEPCARRGSLRPLRSLGLRRGGDLRTLPLRLVGGVDHQELVTRLGGLDLLQQRVLLLTLAEPRRAVVLGGDGPDVLGVARLLDGDHLSTQGVDHRLDGGLRAQRPGLGRVGVLPLALSPQERLCRRLALRHLEPEELCRLTLDLQRRPSRHQPATVSRVPLRLPTLQRHGDLCCLAHYAHPSCVSALRGVTLHASTRLRNSPHSATSWRPERGTERSPASAAGEPRVHRSRSRCTAPCRTPGAAWT